MKFFALAALVASTSAITTEWHSVNCLRDVSIWRDAADPKCQRGATDIEGCSIPANRQNSRAACTGRQNEVAGNVRL